LVDCASQNGSLDIVLLNQSERADRILQKALITIGSVDLTPDTHPIPFPAPVPGNNENMGIPESADIHLYADPTTINSSDPILFLDCEGLDGGNRAPRAANIRQQLAKDGKTMIYKYDRWVSSKDPTRTK
jgi:hypothetical protein